ncbi:MAG: hypothetical protein ACLUNZ_01320 [Evtepia sp.]
MQQRRPQRFLAPEPAQNFSVLIQPEPGKDQLLALDPERRQKQCLLSAKASAASRSVTGENPCLSFPWAFSTVILRATSCSPSKSLSSPPPWKTHSCVSVLCCGS